MTEKEWLEAGNLRRMIHFIKAGGVSDRKLRLFAVACCRRVEVLLSDWRSCEAVETAERHADGGCDDEELRTAYGRAGEAANAAALELGRVGSIGHFIAEGAAARPAVFAAKWVEGSMTVARLGVSAALLGVRWPAGREAQAAQLRAVAADAEATARANALIGHVPDVLLDIMGNPFRPASLEQAWLRWNDGANRKLAAAIYETRSFADLPLLADALEEAGCADPAILSHCRSGGTHVRGCWVVDLLLGKK